MIPKEVEELWEKQKINVFDLTHVWPQKQFPRRRVGEFVLNENAINYFAEIEQAAFSPSHVSPGIEPSADPVLQSRLFSYSDTIVTASVSTINSSQSMLLALASRPVTSSGDGQMAFYNQGARPNHLSSIEPIQFHERTVSLDKTHSHFIGEAITFLFKIRPEDFNAPRALWEMAFDYAAKARFINNVAGKMEDCPNKEILKRQIAYSKKFTPTFPRALRRLLVSRATTEFLECSPTALTMEW